LGSPGAVPALPGVVEHLVGDLGVPFTFRQAQPLLSGEFGLTADIASGNCFAAPLDPNVSAVTVGDIGVVAPVALREPGRTCWMSNA
jgi:hypothetical protein